MRANINLDKEWFVVRTNIKCEDKAARNLHYAGYEVYLPKVRKERKHKRTNAVLVHEHPLMLRYLFVGMPKRNADWFTLRACEGVECVLGIEGRPISVPALEVQALHLAEIDMQFDDTKAARIHRQEDARTRKATVAMKFPRGATVRVDKGTFEGFWATVDTTTSTGSVRVLVDLFNQMTPVDFPPELLSVA